jgi:RNA polymerase sigma-70 factor (ECF subfamily)
VIKAASSDHIVEMADAVVIMEQPTAGEQSGPVPAADARRLRRIVDRDLDFIWRLVRRLGVPEADTDDAVQQCFVVLHHRLGDIHSGDERSFLFATALRVASEWRRKSERRREVDVDSVAEVVDGAPLPDMCVDDERARRLLDALVRALPVDLGAAFVLYEIEGLTAKQIAALLGIPTGTVASRIRRARELFDAALGRITARLDSKGAPK